MCMMDDGDGWEFFTEKIRRAAKEHKCYECGRVIQVGERYRDASGKTGGYLMQMRQCAQCHAATEWLMVACQGYLFGAVEEDLREHVVGEESYLRTRPLTRLVRWMAADWKDRAGNVRSADDVTAVTAEAIAAYRRQYALAVA